MATLADSLSSLRVRLDLPQNVLEEYERQAEEAGRELDELITDRLKNCVGYTSTKPIYITDAQRREMEQALHRNFSDAAQILSQVKKMATLRIGKTPISLGPELQRRLDSRNLDKSKTFDVFLSGLVVRLLEQYVGLR